MSVFKSLACVRAQRRLRNLRAAVVQLPEAQRTVFVVVVVDGRPLSSAATRLGLSNAEAEKRLVEALIAVAANLESRGRPWRWLNRFARRA